MSPKLPRTASYNSLASEDELPRLTDHQRPRVDIFAGWAYPAIMLAFILGHAVSLFLTAGGVGVIEILFYGSGIGAAVFGTGNTFRYADLNRKESAGLIKKVEQFNYQLSEDLKDYDKYVVWFNQLSLQLPEHVHHYLIPKSEYNASTGMTQIKQMLNAIPVPAHYYDGGDKQSRFWGAITGFSVSFLSIPLAAGLLGAGLTAAGAIVGLGLLLGVGVWYLNKRSRRSLAHLKHYTEQFETAHRETRTTLSPRSPTPPPAYRAEDKSTAKIGAQLLESQRRLQETETELFKTKQEKIDRVTSNTEASDNDSPPSSAFGTTMMRAKFDVLRELLRKTKQVDDVPKESETKPDCPEPKK